MTRDDIICMAREAGMVWASGLNGSGYHINHPEDLERFAELVRADNRNRWEHNYEVLMNALWKACGDDAKMVEETIKSQGELK